MITDAARSAAIAGTARRPPASARAPSRMRAVLLALGLLGSSHGILQPGELHELTTIAGMQQFVAEHAKVVLYISNGPCAQCDAFLPDLQDIATRYPQLPLARIDGSLESGQIAANFKVPRGTTVLRALFRNAPPGKRVLVRCLIRTRGNPAGTQWMRIRRHESEAMPHDAGVFRGNAAHPSGGLVPRCGDLGRDRRATSRLVFGRQNEDWEQGAREGEEGPTENSGGDAGVGRCQGQVQLHGLAARGFVTRAVTGVSDAVTGCGRAGVPSAHYRHGAVECLLGL